VDIHEADLQGFDLRLRNELALQESRLACAVDKELAAELHRIVVVVDVDVFRSCLDRAVPVEEIGWVGKPEAAVNNLTTGDFIGTISQEDH
jgi:hypothetical protein